MPIILKNNVDSTLAQAISSSETAAIVTAGDGAKFPALGAGDYFYATLVSAQGTREIVKVTSKSIDTLAITRAQEGTTANGFAVGSRVEMRVTAASITDLVDEHDQASEITIADAGGYYTSGTVEGALQEAMTRANLAASAGSSLVGYNQGGTNAVNRTVQSRLRDTVSVKDFGAVGDGVADDTAAIQTAINSSPAGIYFPQGNYLCGGLTVPAVVQRIYGEGTLLANANNITIMQILTDVSRQRTKDIDGLRFNGNGKTGSTGIKFGSVTNNPSPGAQESVLYVAMRDTHFRAFSVGIDSRVSMEHCYENIVLFQNTVGMKLYSDPVNGGGNSNTFIAMRFEQNTVGCMVVSNAPFPLHNNIFLGCIWQNNSVCGLFTKGFSGSGKIASLSVKSFHTENNGYGAATVVIDGITVKKSDFHFVESSVSLEDAGLSATDPAIIAETSTNVAAINLTGYGATTGRIYAPDSTSKIYEIGLAPSVGIKQIETYGLLDVAGDMAVIGSPKVSLGFYRNDSTMPNPAIPLLNNTVGAITTLIDKDRYLGLMSGIQFAASPGSTSTNRNYWDSGSGTAGDLFLFSVICLSTVDSTIRFYTLQTGVLRVFDVSFVANVPRRIVISGTLAGTQGLQVFTFPTDSAGATLFFKAHEYVMTTDLSIINDVYQNGLCGVRTLNYEQLSAPPTTGTWNRNDVVWNSASAAATTPGWVCVSGGTPGTWKAMATLAA